MQTGRHGTAPNRSSLPPGVPLVVTFCQVDINRLGMVSWREHHDSPHVVQRPMKMEKMTGPTALGSFSLMATLAHVATPRTLAGINLDNMKDARGTRRRMFAR